MSDHSTSARPGRLTPLASIAVVVALLVAVLPSALIVRPNSPSRTLEYAPLPQTNRSAESPPGNLASLGLAGSSAVTSSGGSVPDGHAGGTASGTGARPSVKRCVGRPARQTEDPLAPPCVAYFAGDNFG